MPTFQNAAPGSKSSKFTALDPFAPFLAQPDDMGGGDDITEQPIMTEELDRRLQSSCRVSSGMMQQQSQQQPLSQVHQQQQQQQMSNNTTSSTGNENNNMTNITTTTTSMLKKSNNNNKDEDEDDNSDDNSDSDDSDLFEDDYDDDLTLEAFRLRRLNEMKNEYEIKSTQLAKGHGQIRTITQDEFLPETTKCDNDTYVVVHWFHNDFERCKIMDHHLKKIATKFLSCKFLRINAEKAPFFITKLKIQTLPTLIIFQNGKIIHRLTGFEGLTTTNHTTTSNKKYIDEWPTKRLVQWLATTGAIQYIPGKDDIDFDDDDDSDDDNDNNNNNQRRGGRSIYSIQSRFNRYDEDN